MSNEEIVTYSIIDNENKFITVHQNLWKKGNIVMGKYDCLNTSSITFTAFIKYCKG